MRNDSRPQSLNGDINVTPFLDVLLVLIITFVAAMTVRKTMDAQLPVACAQGACGSNRNDTVLEVLADGSYRLNGMTLTAMTLRTGIHDAFEGRPDKVLQLAGHRDARYQSVLSAMDVAKAAGVKVISLPPSASYDASR